SDWGWPAHRPWPAWPRPSAAPKRQPTATRYETIGSSVPPGSRPPRPPPLVFTARGRQILADLGDNIGVLIGNVGFLGDVVLQVVQHHRGLGTAAADAFEPALVQRRLPKAALVKFPVQKLVRRLPGRIALKR